MAFYRLILGIKRGNLRTWVHTVVSKMYVNGIVVFHLVFIILGRFYIIVIKNIFFKKHVKSGLSF